MVLKTKNRHRFFEKLWDKDTGEDAPLYIKKVQGAGGGIAPCILKRGTKSIPNSGDGPNLMMGAEDYSKTWSIYIKEHRVTPHKTLTLIFM